MGDQVRDLTLYVLNESAQQWAAWCHAGFCTTVSTNLSARVLMDKSIATDVRRILQAHSVPGGNAQLEITESAMNSDPARAIETIADLNTLGHHNSVSYARPASQPGCSCCRTTGRLQPELARNRHIRRSSQIAVPHKI